MRHYILTVTLMACSLGAMAQTAGDVLENGIRVKPGEKVFLRFVKNGSIQFDIAKSLIDPASPVDYIALPDSTIFLPSKTGINVYLAPMNPLGYSHKQEIKLITDPINDAAAKGTSSVFDILKLVQPPRVLPQGTNPANNQPLDTCSNFKKIENTLRAIQAEIQDDQKNKIVLIFKAMTDISFAKESVTISDISTAKKDMEPVESHFENIDKLVKKTSSLIESYDCGNLTSFLTKNVFNNILKELKSTAEEQKKRLKNLQQVYAVLMKAKDEASAGDGVNGLTWCLKLDEIPVSDSKTAIYTITIKESGYKLSDENEIVAFEGNKVVERVIRVRKFQLFVPEISTGAFYTFFTYQSYGTTTNSSGQQVVGEPTKNSIKNINITAMMNWNLYTPNSLLHPLFQVGAGINSGIPSFLVGGGLRFRNKATNRIRIGTGFALTWIKELDKLQVGSEVSGTDDIEKDLKYTFQWPPKPYIGIQYNF